MSEKALVEVVGVSKIYRQGVIEVTALSNIDLEIGRGDFAVLAGPSGSGKTTLLNMIGALDKPTRGTVMVDGANVNKLSESRTAKIRLTKMGFVFQAYNLIPVLSAYENAEYVLLLQGMPRAERQKRVNELLEAVGLKDLHNLHKRRPDELSGGQQQRVAIARALAARPALVLADEPTANLDSKTAIGLVDLMRALNKDRGVTFVISSHDGRVIDRAERVVELEDGKITADTRSTDAA